MEPSWGDLMGVRKNPAREIWLQGGGAACWLAALAAACSAGAPPAPPPVPTASSQPTTQPTSLPTPVQSVVPVTVGNRDLEVAFQPMLAVSGTTDMKGAGAENVSNGATAEPSPLPSASPSPMANLALNLNGPGYSLGGLSEVIDSRSKDENVIEKIAFVQKILKSQDAASCKPTVRFRRVPTSNCFGGRVTASEGQVTSDSPLLKFPMDLKTFENMTSRGFPVGKTLVTRENDEAGNTCLASAAGQVVAQASDYIDRAMGLLAGMNCAARIEGKSKLPETGRLDVKAELKRVWALPKEMDVLDAFFERIDGPVETYRTFLKMKLVSPQGEERTALFDFTNSPDAKKTENSKGRLVMLESGNDWRFGAKVGALSLSFTRTDDSLRLKFQKADFVRDLNPMTVLDADTGYFSFSDVEKNANIVNVAQGIFALNVSLGTGDFGYIWASAPGDSASRMIVSNLMKEEDGTFTGCAVAGFSKRFDEDGVGKLKGMHCAWGQEKSDGTALDESFSPLVQKQCFKRSATAKTWTMTSQKLKYVVADDCGKVASDTGLANWIDLESVQAEGLIAGEVRVPKALKPLASPVKKEEIKLK